MKTEFRGYADRFEKGGETLLDFTKEALCQSQIAGGQVVTEGCDDGTKGLYRQVWRKGDVKGRALYAIIGGCPKGHKVERYGYGEIPAKAPKLVVRGES
jgi:hypothetical protein